MYSPGAVCRHLKLWPVGRQKSSCNSCGPAPNSCHPLPAAAVAAPLDAIPNAGAGGFAAAWWMTRCRATSAQFRRERGLPAAPPLPSAVARQNGCAQADTALVGKKDNAVLMRRNGNCLVLACSVDNMPASPRAQGLVVLARAREYWHDVKRTNAVAHRGVGSTASGQVCVRRMLSRNVCLPAECHFYSLHTVFTFRCCNNPGLLTPVRVPPTPCALVSSETHASFPDHLKMSTFAAKLAGGLPKGTGAQQQPGGGRAGSQSGAAVSQNAPGRQQVGFNVNTGNDRLAFVGNVLIGYKVEVQVSSACVRPAWGPSRVSTRCSLQEWLLSASRGCGLACDRFVRVHAGQERGCLRGRVQLDDYRGVVLVHCPEVR